MITFTFFRQYLAVLEQRGIEVKKVLTRAGIAPSLLDDPNARMNGAEHDHLWEILLNSLTPADLTLKTGDTLAPASLSSLVYLAMSFENGLLALRSLIDNKNSGSDIKLKLETQGDTVKLSLSDEYKQLKYAHHFLGLAVQHVIDLLFWLSKTNIIPIRIEIIEAKSSSLFSFVETHNSCLIAVKDSPCLVFKTQDLNFSLAGSNEKLRQVLARESKNEISLFNTQASFSELVQLQLARCFIDFQESKQTSNLKHSISLKATAAYFCMTTRTLQRKLKTQDTNFSAVLDNVRMKQITFHLSQGKGLFDIAALAGFSDGVSLGRFMKRCNR
ncbi:MAG: AraC family transcriptional regulator ligand-binding domain-containing protein [Bermanella sp.]